MRVMYRNIFRIALLAFVALSLTTAAGAQEVYLVPALSSAASGNTAEVEIWVNANGFYGGQVNLTYDPTCAKVTNWARNTTSFPLGGWSHYEGREWITFSAIPPTPLLSGSYMIGRLTIECVNEKGNDCATPLSFIEQSRVFNDIGVSIPITWSDGTFSSTPIPSYTSTPTPASSSTPHAGGNAGISTESPTPPSHSPSTESPDLTAHTTLSTPSSTATASPSTSPEPSYTAPSKRKTRLPGFQAAVTISGLFAAVYLLKKRKVNNQH